MKTTVQIILGVSLLINVLVGIFLWRNPKIINFGVDNETQLRDSVDLLVKERIEIRQKVDSLNRSNDSLIMLKTYAKAQYYETTHVIYSADPATVDSIIRKLSGLKIRH